MTDICKPSPDRYPTPKENALNALKGVVGLGWAVEGLADSACQKANKEHQDKQTKKAREEGNN